MGNILDVTKYGAVGDGKTLNTRAIQKVIDACMNGDTVLIPEGIFITGALFLKGDMTLTVNGRLKGSEDTADYQVFKYGYEGLTQPCFASLINVKGDCENNEISNPHAVIHKNITINGTGTIDGSGTVLFEKELTENGPKRGRTICIRNTDGVTITGVKVRHSPAWCLHLLYCKNVLIENMEIHSRFDEDGNIYGKVFNNDGLDLDSCDNCVVRNSLIASGDDCIAIKSGRDAEGRRVGIASENIEIYNNTFKYGWGVVMGSEMSGGVRNVYVHDCEFLDTFSFAAVKAPRGRGAVVTDIVFERIKHYYANENYFKDCKWFRGALYIDNYYGLDVNDYNRPEEAGSGTPFFRNLVFRDVTSETVGGNGIFICGLPEQHIKHVVLKNFHMKAKCGIVLHNVDDLDWDNVTQELF